ncbi:MAG: hydrogenase maturation nickel metallochaperone HypA [Candidatus Omnitrophota bacterium]
MHEYHIVEKIVNQAAEKTKSEGASRITKITLALGELSGFAESSVRLYFETISVGTAAEGAELIIKPLCSSKKLYIENIEVE